MSSTTRTTADERLLYTVIAVALVAKLADVATTAYWLNQPGAREFNPAVVAAYQSLGAVGGIAAILALSALMIGIVELVAWLVSRPWSGWSPWYRLAAYGSLGALWLGAAVVNLTVIA